MIWHILCDRAMMDGDTVVAPNLTFKKWVKPINTEVYGHAGGFKPDWPWGTRWQGLWTEGERP